MARRGKPSSGTRLTRPSVIVLAPVQSSEPAAPSKKAPPPCLYSFSDPDALSKGLATFVLNAQDEALKKQPTFKIAVSGGSLPKVLGQDLIGRHDVKWDKWSVLFPCAIRPGSSLFQGDGARAC